MSIAEEIKIVKHEDLTIVDSLKTEGSMGGGTSSAGSLYKLREGSSVASRKETGSPSHSQKELHSANRTKSRSRPI